MSEGSFEAKLTAKRETAAGIYLTIQVQPDDYRAELATLRVGSALMMGWSEIVNSTVEPIPKIEDFSGITDLMRGENAKARKPFSSLPPSQQSALMCDDLRFAAWICSFSVHAYNHKNPEMVAICLREALKVKSRSELDKDESAAEKWRLIQRQYQAHLTTLQYADSKR